MKNITLFGAGKSATVLIDYLLAGVDRGDWSFTLCDRSLAHVEEKMGKVAGVKAVAVDVQNAEEVQWIISTSTVVISLLPPQLHGAVARACLENGKHLLTASYIDDAMRVMGPEVKAKNLLFLCEMGLDPGIDHMSAKELLDRIQAEGGKVTSFLSHCGGLVAPESDDNPWHYKISWNPRNVVNAGKAGASFMQDGDYIHLPHVHLFEEQRFVEAGGEEWCWYPNRDSLSYRQLYGLDDCRTFIRTTLRHPDFIWGWKNIIELGLTSEEAGGATPGTTLAQFFKQHFEKVDFSGWLLNRMQEQMGFSKTVLDSLLKMEELEEEARQLGSEVPAEVLYVDEGGALQDLDVEETKLAAAAGIADSMHKANISLKQLFFLGLDDEETLLPPWVSTPADALQFALEQKLPLREGDKDLVVMLHEVEWEKEGKRYRSKSHLRLEGEDAVHTAMAKTVGLPLGIAASLLLQDKLSMRGVIAPIAADIYKPVLAALAEAGIVFLETEEEV